MKTVKNKKQKNTTTATMSHDHPGRPRYTMVYPATLTFTFVELMQSNGVDTRRKLKNGDENPNYGRGNNCTMLTVRKNLKFALANDDAFLMRGYTAGPDSNGLGRRGLLYRHVDTPFAKALVEAKVRGRKAKTAEIEKTIANAKAILSEPAATVQIAPATPAPEVIPAPENITPASTIEHVESPATVPTENAIIVPAPAAEPQVVTPDMVVNAEKA
jgi:hypothetical protein